MSCCKIIECSFCSFSQRLTSSIACIHSLTCGDLILDVRQRLTSSLVKSAVRQIADKFDEKNVEQWMQRTVAQIIEACSNLSAGEEGTADSDDVKGDLPLATVTSTLFSSDVNDSSADFALM